MAHESGGESVIGSVPTIKWMGGPQTAAPSTLIRNRSPCLRRLYV
jgi:hypothetical protein